jgi:hypothetical protein
VRRRVPTGRTRPEDAEQAFQVFEDVFNKFSAPDKVTSKHALLGAEKPCDPAAEIRRYIGVERLALEKLALENLALKPKDTAKKGPRLRAMSEARVLPFLKRLEEKLGREAVMSDWLNHRDSPDGCITQHKFRNGLKKLHDGRGQGRPRKKRETK